MLIDFFSQMRRHKIPCSLRELLDLHAALAARLVSVDMDDFYQLSRCLLVKDEAHFDRFDRAFAEALGVLCHALLDGIGHEGRDRRAGSRKRPEESSLFR